MSEVLASEAAPLLGPVAVLEADSEAPANLPERSNDAAFLLYSFASEVYAVVSLSLFLRTITISGAAIRLNCIE